MHARLQIGMQVYFYLCSNVVLVDDIILQSSFVLKKNERIAAIPYQVVLTELETECAAKCLSSLSCIAANFFEEARTCYMFNKTCFFVEDAIGWQYLSRPPPSRAFKYIQSRLTWNNAKDYCESIGGGLANIRTTTDNDDILNTILELENLPEQVWLGGSDRDIEGKWVWSNGCRFEDQDFDFWRTGEPNNVNNTEHCLGLVTQGSQWNDIGCDETRHFVCEANISFP